MKITTNPPARRGAGTRRASGPRPLLSALAGAVALALAAPAQAATELDALKAELEQQRRMLERQQKMIERLEANLAKQEAAPAAAAGPAATGAVAQGGGDKPLVTIYGILDGGVEHVTNIGAEGKSVTRVPPITATLPSRLGFRLYKAFRPGYAAIGTLEAGFNLDDGTQGQDSSGRRIFGRQLFAGVETPYGSFTVGRQWSMLTAGMTDVDQLGPNIYGLSSLDVYLPNSRYDNSLAWQGKFDKLRLGVAYSFGRDTTSGAPASGTCAGEQNSIADTQECKARSAFVRYDDAHFGLAAAVDEIKGGTGAQAFFFNGAAPFAMTDSKDKDRRIAAGGYVKFGDAKLSLGWLGRKVDTAAQDVESNAYYLAASYQLTPVISVDGGIHRIVNSDQDRDATLSVVRAFYKLDKGLDTYVQVGHIENSKKAAYSLSGAGPGTAPAAGESQNGYMAGMRYLF